MHSLQDIWVARRVTQKAGEPPKVNYFRRQIKQVLLLGTPKCSTLLGRRNPFATLLKELENTKGTMSRKTVKEETRKRERERERERGGREGEEKG